MEEIILPTIEELESLPSLTHRLILDTIIKHNPLFKDADPKKWIKIPDLVDNERNVVELALTDLDTAWGQCLSYHREGAKLIFLILQPYLFKIYQNRESLFIKTNPLSNVIIQSLPMLLIKRLEEAKQERKKIRLENRKDSSVAKWIERVEGWKIPENGRRFSTNKNIEDITKIPFSNLKVIENKYEILEDGRIFINRREPHIFQSILIGEKSGEFFVPNENFIAYG